MAERKSIHKMIKLLLASVLFSYTATAQDINSIVVNSSGNTLQSSAGELDINIGEPITGIIINGTTAISQGFLQPSDKQFSSLNLKLYIQGYYAGNQMMQPVLMNQGVSSASGLLTDTITVELHDQTNGNLIETTTAVLKTDGTATANFSLSEGAAVYLVIKHRNTVETWSANPLNLLTNDNYDFTNDATKAYGNNMAEVENGVFALYSGDINQDGAIESSDYLTMENDVLSILFGYSNSDITGDGVVESADYLLMENNVLQVIFSVKPF